MPHLSRRRDHIGSSGNAPIVTLNTSVPLNTNVYNHITNLDVQIRIPHTSLVATGWTLGGGDGAEITGGWFAVNRRLTAGRGTRNEIYGNAMYGSGYGTYTKLGDGTYQYDPVYTIGVNTTFPDTSSTYNRDLPHGFPALPWGAYLGALGLASAQISDVPGTIPQSPLPSNATYSTNSHWRRMHNYWLKQFSASKGNQTYVILSEPATSDFLQLVLSQPVDQGGCGIDSATAYLTQIWQPLFYNETENNNDPGLNAPFAAAYASPTDEIFMENSQIYQWNVLQYYRGSSVALISKAYDNKQSHLFVSQNVTYWGSSAMNTTGMDMDFLQCLNTTIATAVPIIDPSLKVVKDLSGGAIAGIVLGSVGFLCILIWLACGGYRLCIGRKKYEPVTVPKSKPVEEDVSDDETLVKRPGVLR